MFLHPNVEVVSLFFFIYFLFKITGVQNESDSSVFTTPNKSANYKFTVKYLYITGHIPYCDWDLDFYSFEYKCKQHVR